VFPFVSAWRYSPNANRRDSSTAFFRSPARSAGNFLWYHAVAVYVGTSTAKATSLFGAGLSVWYVNSADTSTIPFNSIP
jgi:hypothetical protein